jgi:murE/murF fusion protein
VTLAELFAAGVDRAGARAARPPDAAAGARPVRSVQSDSRAVGPGDVYVAVRGRRADGHDFAAAAVAQGAIGLVVERELPLAVPQLVAVDGADALGVLAGYAAGDPARAMTLIAVTGTNGKTTTTYLLESILLAAGAVPGVIGTVTYRWGGPGGTAIDAPYSTPTPQILHDALARMRAAGCTHVVMEATSAALVMQRVAGIAFAVAGFSNLTQDHLDLHGTMEAYRDAKRLLFTRHLAPGSIAVINVDDAEGPGMAAAAAPHRVLRVTRTPGAAPSAAEIRVTAADSTVRGIAARIATPRGDVDVRARPLLGAYNVENLALAVGMAEALGLPHEAIARGIAQLPGVPGRVERVPNDAELDIIVDYAHTPDALRNVLATLRPLTRRRLVCVFGCGGDRDPTKRPRMGAAVAELADAAIVTSDNPRTEDPRAIIDQILPGVPRPALVEVDRRIAIQAAIAEAVPGDIVAIVGKGHEDYQIIGTTKHHFDDREEAAAATRARWSRTLGELAADAGGELRGEPAAGATRVTRVTIDSRDAAPGDLYVAIRGATHDGHAFCAAALAAGAAAVLVERDHPTPLPPGAPAIAVGDARAALGALARAHRRRWPGRVIAITGSTGKTTTKDLARAALAEAAPAYAAAGSLNNETGVPQALLALRAVHAYGVIELGMRGRGQIEYLTHLAEPDVAVVVNAGTAHLELLGSTDAIAEAKSEIWLGLRPGGAVIRPAGDARLERWARRHRPDARHVTFGEADEAADVALVGYEAVTGPGGTEASRVAISAHGERHELILALVGRHAAIDACAALAAALAAGAPLALAVAGLSRARPAAMRGEVITAAGRRVIVDCYNANPASMAAALRALAERAARSRARALAVVGDMLELGDHASAAHREAGALARQLGAGVIALGDHAAEVVDGAGGPGGEPAAERAADPMAAAARALARTAPGDWILVKASRGMRLERVLEALRAHGDRREPGRSD